MHKFVLPLLAAALASGQTITTIAGNGTAGFAGDGGQATQAQINRAVGQAIDSAGNLYLAEELNNRVRKITPQGVITTIAGTGSAGLQRRYRPRCPSAVERSAGRLRNLHRRALRHRPGQQTRA